MYRHLARIATVVAVIVLIDQQPAQGFMENAHRSAGIVGRDDASQLGRQRSDYGHYDNGGWRAVGKHETYSYDLGTDRIGISRSRTFDYERTPSRYHSDGTFGRINTGGGERARSRDISERASSARSGRRGD